MPEIPANPGAVPPLLERADTLVTDLSHAIPKALGQFDEQGIHKARVATRRLTAVSKLMKPLTSKHHRKPFERVLRKLRRLLGDLRDLDVMSEHLKTVGADPQSAASAQRLAQHLLHQREKVRAALTRKKPADKMLQRLNGWSDFRAEIAELAAAIDSLISHQLHEQLLAFAGRAGSLANPGTHERTDPHQLRIAGKQLRYTLELAEIQNNRIEAKIVRAFKKMQEELGQWHDHLVLAVAAADLAKMLLEQEHDALAAAGQHQLAVRALKIAAKRLNNFSRLWKRQGESITRAIRAAFPLTRARNGSQTDRDPPSSPQTPPPAAPQPTAISDAPA